MNNLRLELPPSIFDSVSDERLRLRDAKCFGVNKPRENVDATISANRVLEM